MKRVLAVAVVAFLTLTASGRAEDKKPAKPPLPRADTVKWDVSVFEESATYTFVKRDEKNGEVTWVLENRKDIGSEHIFGYRAEFQDEDGVKLFAVGIAMSPFPTNLRQGERNRFILAVPRPEHWKGVKKVVIRGG